MHQAGSMAHRDFTDSHGTEWLVFDVQPRPEDRRARERRHRENPELAAEADRRTEDRRLTIAVQGPPRITQGWLCFESDRERRRLQPIPENWLSVSDAELEQLLAKARVAPLRKRAERLI